MCFLRPMAGRKKCSFGLEALGSWEEVLRVGHGEKSIALERLSLTKLVMFLWRVTSPEDVPGRE